MTTISDRYLHHGAHQSDREYLQSGGEYIHCGEPMPVAGSELRSTYAPMTTEPVPADVVLDAYLRTRVLRCICGFQMEIPE
jgi:hypothetical protein